MSDSYSTTHASVCKHKSHVVPNAHTVPNGSHTVPNGSHTVSNGSHTDSTK